MKKNLLLQVLAILIVPIFAIFFLEILFTAGYFLSKSKFFESKIENYDRKNILPYEIIEGKDYFSPGDKRIKIAVFGGSSAAGWGTAMNFSQIIQSKIFTDKNLIVHNYAEPGDPFVSFQAEILKAVMPHYDVMIVYAGNNEWLGKVYEGIQNTSKPRTLPNNHTIELLEYANVKKQLKQRVENYAKYHSPYYRSLKPGKFNFHEFTDRSRIWWFSYRALNRIYSIIKKFSNKNQLSRLDHDQRKFLFKHYYSEKFLTPEERKSILVAYKKTIMEIIERLKPNQKLFLSTVLSNDLFPPHAEVLNISDLEQIKSYENHARKSYQALLEKDYASLKVFAKNLPIGPNRSYLEGRHCLGASWEDKIGNSNCVNLLEETRRTDGYPVQVIPEINSFIRELRLENVFIGDPIKKLNNSVSFKDYNNHFVDFQHPSALGHFVIANEILIKLFKDYKEPVSYSFDECDNITVQKNSKKIVIKPNSFYHYWSIKDNIDLLDHFIKKYSSKYYQYYFDYFKNKETNKKNFCNIEY